MTIERRSSKRWLLRSRVEITGLDESGFQFREETRFEDFSDTGCRISLRHPVRRGVILAIEHLGPDGENLPEEYSRLFVVVWSRRTADRQFVGARCLLEDELSDGGRAAQRFRMDFATD